MFIPGNGFTQPQAVNAKKVFYPSHAQKSKHL